MFWYYLYSSKTLNGRHRGKYYSELANVFKAIDRNLIVFFNEKDAKTSASDVLEVTVSKMYTCYCEPLSLEPPVPFVFSAAIASLISVSCCSIFLQQCGPA